MNPQSWRRRGSLVAVLLLMVSLVVSACSTKASEGDNVASAAPKAPSKTELRIAIPGDGDTMDPATMSYSYTFAVATNIYSGLVRYKPGTLEIMPDLAETWDTSADGKTWTFHLRKGVKWQKGYGELTAQDVVDSFQRIIDPKGGSRWRAELADVISVTAPDTSTVVFQLKAPNAAFLHSVVVFRQGMVTKKEAVTKYGQDYGRNPVGTGAYELEKWVPNTEITLKANNDFYLGKPAIQTIHFVVIPDENVRMMALQNGEVDIAMGLSNPSLREQLAGNAGINLAEIESNSVSGILLNTRMKPFDNPQVRRALYMAIDRDSIANVVLKGMATPATGELTPALFGFTKNVPHYDYDPQKAKQMLADAGYPAGFESTLYWLNTAPKEVLDTLLANWKAVGVNLKVNMVDAGTWVSTLGKGEPPMDYFSAGRSDPNVYYKSFYHSSAFPPGLNAFYYSGADDLIDAGAREMDPTKRAAIYAQIQQKTMTDLPFLPLWWSKQSHPAWKYVQGWQGLQNYDAWVFPLSIKQ